MTADQGLNDVQFMSVRRLMKMPSVDASSNAFPTAVGPHASDSTSLAHRSGRTNSVAPEKMRDIDWDDSTAASDDFPRSYGDDMREAIANGTIDPVHVNTGEHMSKQYGNSDIPDINRNRLMVGNGQHRVALAAEMGVTHLPVTGSAQNSGQDWKNTKPPAEIGPDGSHAATFKGSVPSFGGLEQLLKPNRNI